MVAAGTIEMIEDEQHSLLYFRDYTVIKSINNKIEKFKKSLEGGVKRWL
jgi:hypothetical protein